MCSVLLDVSPDDRWPVLLMATRDEFTDRLWEAPGTWWPGYPAAHGGYDREAGGSWLAVNARGPVAAIVLNGPEPPAGTAGSWLSRGDLPLRAVSGHGLPDRAALARTRPFHLVRLTPASATVLSWDGAELTTTPLGEGRHLIGNLGADHDGDPRVRTWLPRLRSRPRPQVGQGRRAEQCWQPWLELLRSHAGRPSDASALVARIPVGDRVHATLSLSGVALALDDVRYDFARLTRPGAVDAVAWQRVL